jgi:outer membrane protein TolC
MYLLNLGDNARLREKLRRVCAIFALMLALVPSSPAFAGDLEVDIEQALKLALVNNSRVKISESDAVLAKEARRQAHRAGGVTVSVTHSSSYTDYQAETYRLQGYGHYGESYSNQVTATYPLYTGGAISGAIKKADRDYESQNEALRKSRQDLKLDVVCGVYAILQAEDAAHQAEESVKRLTAHVENVAIQYENGRVGKADLLRSEVELSNAKQSRIRALSDLDTAMKQLNSLMGVPLDTRLRVNEKMTYQEYAPTLEECLSLAGRVHPDLARASLAVKSAEAGVRVAKGQRLPQASLTVTQNLGSAKEWPGAEVDTLSVGVSVAYTVMDAGVGASKVSSAKESVRRARYNYEQARESVLLAVNSDYNSITEAAQRVEESVSAVSKAQEAYNIAVNRYNEGVGTNLDVVDSQSALTLASSNHTQALCDYNIALARIENSMGGVLECLP